MPIPLSNEQREALSRNAIGVRCLIDFHLDSGRYSFWDGDTNWSYDGATYLAVSEFGVISAINAGKDLGAEGVEVRLNGTRLIEAGAAGGAPPVDVGALFGTIEAETYQLRRVDIRFVFFDANTLQLLFVMKRYAGLIDQIRQVEQIDRETGRVESWLVVALESVARRYGVRSARTRSDADQQDIWPGDTFFKFTAASIAQRGSKTWGRRASTALPGGGVASGTVKNTPLHDGTRTDPW